MDDQNPIPKYYAVLIGIDAYAERPLKSCISDVQRVKGILDKKLDLADIQTLTASRSSIPDVFTPVEDPDHWPTCRNVTLALQKIIREGKNGDFVYIHYSGHGTRIGASFTFSDTSTGDLALVLLGGERGNRTNCLKGPTLAGLLNDMVKSGLIVTLVLDCCFSAAVYRSDAHEVRYFPYDPRGDYSHHLEDIVADINTRSTIRGASMRDNWLVDPDGYAILAACGPHESAKGGFEKEEKGRRYGALSYFLSSALSDYGLGRRHQDIHRHLCAVFWERCVEQNPVLYGNKDQAFFGPADSSRGERAISIVTRNEILKLCAGQAHGICDGDRFVVFPPGSKQDSCAKDCFAMVTRAGPLTSDFELVDSQRDVKGWIAEPLTCLYFTKYPLRLASNLPHRGKLLEELRGRSLSICHDKDQAPAFQVVLNNNKYEILDDSSRKIINLPVMPQNQTDSQGFGEVLEHLARFRIVKDLVNESLTGSFRQSFDVQIVQGGERFGPEQEIEVQHDTILNIVMENKGEMTLYIHVYDLGPCWEINGIFCGTYATIPARNPYFTGISRTQIKMKVPPVLREYRSCEDVIKVFITSQPTSFSSLELPIFDVLPKTHDKDRISEPDDYKSEDWVALNFPIRTML